MKQMKITYLFLWFSSTENIFHFLFRCTLRLQVLISRWDDRLVHFETLMKLAKELEKIHAITISEFSTFGWCFSWFPVITLSLMQQNKSQRIFSSTSTKKAVPLQRVWVSIFWNEWQNGLLQGKCKHAEDNEGRSTERQLIWDLRHHKSLGRVWYHF